jgi:tetratricopeptide (TPR) repeat protein
MMRWLSQTVAGGTTRVEITRCSGSRAVAKRTLLLRDQGKRRHASWFVLLMLGASMFGVLASKADDSLTKGIELFRHQQYQKAEKVLEQVVSANESNATGQYYLGRTDFMLCDYDQAITHLQRAIDLENRQSDYYYWLGRAYGEKTKRSGLLKQAGLAKKVRTAFEQAVVLDPNSVAARAALGNFYAQAPKFMGGGMGKATEQAAALMELDPLEGELLKARILEEQKKPDDAEAIYKGLEERYGNSPGAPDIYRQYGGFLLRQDRPRDAIGKLQKQVELEPNDPSAYFDLAVAYEAAGRSQEATAEYQKAAQINSACKSPKKR